jgi:NAD(P)H-nitrite reductase large subunit
MELDAKVCLCFRVTRRKLLNFIRLERPRVASQLSQCGGAGTGCGWCVPYLQKLFAGRDQAGELDALSDEEYARGRAEHIRSGKGKPPPDAAGG